MGIFSSMRDFLFGKHPAAAAVALGAPRQPPQAQQIVPTAPLTQAAPAEPVDIAALLDTEAAEMERSLNWRQSIVDLMKICRIDPSLANRKELAHELGYTGNSDDSAAMNMWLYRQVMAKLEQSGGVVPAELKD